MDENVTEVVETTEAAPESEPADTQDGQAETESTEEAQPGEGTAEGEADPPAEPPEETQEEKQEEEAPPQSITIPVYGEEREFTPEEAAPLIESGMKWNEFAESYDNLLYISCYSGKNVHDFIAELKAASDKAMLASIKQERGCDDDTAAELFEHRKAQIEKKYGERKASDSQERTEKAMTKAEELKERLANGFLELSKEFPDDFKAFKDVPKSVVDSAVKNNISLLDAYLRYERRERMKSEAAKAKQAEAAKQSTGSMRSQTENRDPAIEAFLEGFRRG